MPRVPAGAEGCLISARLRVDEVDGGIGSVRLPAQRTKLLTAPCGALGASESASAHRTRALSWPSRPLVCALCMTAAAPSRCVPISPKTAAGRRASRGPVVDVLPSGAEIVMRLTPETDGVR